MMDEFVLDLTDMADERDDVGEVITDTSEVDADWDSKFPNELYALRGELEETGDIRDAPNDCSFNWNDTPTHIVEWDDKTDNVGEVVTDTSDIDMYLDSKSLDELYALRDELTEIEDPGDVSNDCSFNWDGTPTHNVEWDDETSDTTYVLKR